MTSQVTTRPVAREVVAVYKIDEASLELVVTMPENHPLGAIAVESGKKTSVDVTQWENWMLQLKTFLTPLERLELNFEEIRIRNLILDGGKIYAPFCSAKSNRLSHGVRQTWEN